MYIYIVFMTRVCVYNTRDNDTVNVDNINDNIAMIWPLITVCDDITDDVSDSVDDEKKLTHDTTKRLLTAS